MATDPAAVAKMMQGIWDNIAPTYDKFTGDGMMAPATNLIVETVQNHLAHQMPSHPGSLDVLDLAGGSGWPAIPLANAFPLARITSSDLSPKMVALAAQRVKMAGLADRISTQPADIQDLSAWQDASFDAVTCQYGLQFTPDITGAMREAARVLRPGGLYVAAVNGAKSQMDQVHFELVRETTKELDLTVPPQKMSWERLADVSKMAADLEAAGFTRATAKPFMHDHMWQRSEDLATFVNAVMGSAVSKARQAGRSISEDDVAQACINVMKRLGVLSEDGTQCVTRNEACLYTAVRP